jgi:hypothetical protein
MPILLSMNRRTDNGKHPPVWGLWPVVVVPILAAAAVAVLDPTGCPNASTEDVDTFIVLIGVAAILGAVPNVIAGTSTRWVVAQMLVTFLLALLFAAAAGFGLSAGQGCFS